MAASTTQPVQSEQPAQPVLLGQAPKTILITGATSTTGYELVSLLTREHRGQFRVIAGVHQQTQHSSDLLSDVDVVRHIDADDHESLSLEGVDILFIIPSNAETRVEQVRYYVEAAKQYKVQHIFLLSVVLSEKRDTLFARQFHDMERSVSDSDIPCTFLRCTFFQQNFLANAEEIRERGTVSLPIRHGKCAPVNIRDVARASVALLSNIALHARKAYNLVGPELLDGPAIAAAISRALGIKIRFVDVSTSRFLKMSQSQGLPKWLAAGFSEILELVAAHKLSTLETHQFFIELTGRGAITLEDFFRENYHHFVAYPGITPNPKSSFNTGVSSRTLATGTSSYSNSGRNTQLVNDEVEELRVLIKNLVIDRENKIAVTRQHLDQTEARLDKLMDFYHRLGRRSSYPPKEYDRLQSYGQNYGQEYDQGYGQSYGQNSSQYYGQNYDDYSSQYYRYDQQPYDYYPSSQNYSRSAVYDRYSNKNIDYGYDYNNSNSYQNSYPSSYDQYESVDYYAPSSKGHSLHQQNTDHYNSLTKGHSHHQHSLKHERDEHTTRSSSHKRN